MFPLNYLVCLLITNQADILHDSQEQNIVAYNNHYCFWVPPQWLITILYFLKYSPRVYFLQGSAELEATSVRTSTRKINLSWKFDQGNEHTGKSYSASAAGWEE